MPRPLSEQAREKAVDAAQAIMAESGIGALTMDGVAKRSGVAKTTLYRHWSSSNELLMHAIDCTIQHLPTPDTGSFASDLRALYETVAERMAEAGMRQMMLDMASAAAHDPELEQLKGSLFEERTRPIREIVRRAIERGELPDLDPAEVVVLVEGPMIARVVLSPDPITDEELDHFVAFVVRGLQATND